MPSHKKGNTLRNLTLAALISLIPTGALFAAGSCKVQDGPSKEVRDYIKNTDDLIQSLVREAGKYRCEKKTDGTNSATDSIQRASSEITKDINQVLTFENFSSSSRFYIDMVMKSEIPREINRDHELIKGEQAKIQQVYSTIYARCAEGKTISSNLSKVASYDTSWKTIGTVISEVLENHIKVLNFYRETVLGDSDADNVETSPSFILVNPNFAKDLNDSYGPKGFEACVKEKDYFKRVKEAIDRIGNLWGDIGQGIQEWKSAWQLLNGETSNYAEIERDLLRNELWKQGVGTKGAEIMLNNLAEYNANYAKQDGVTGFIASIGERVYQSAKSFENVYKGLKSFVANSNNTVEYMERSKELQFLKSNLNQELIAEYNTAKSLIGTENQTTDQNIGHLINMHIMLQSTAKQIKSNIPVATKVCNSQYTGMGNCNF